MKITIIDYGMGNLRSVEKAFHSLDFSVEITNDYKKIQKADKLVLPGVGAFRDAIGELKRYGIDSAIMEAIQKEKPFLGICLGMQLLFEKSYENGEYEGLGILPGEIVRFPWKDKLEAPVDSLGIPLKIPHMGWNTLEVVKPEPIFKEVKGEPAVYFVHSYYLKTKAPIVSAYVTYGEKIAVAVQKDYLFAMQFHPEKSGAVGLQLLRNFGGI